MKIEGIEVINTDAVNEEVMLYTEDEGVHRILSKINRTCATYERIGRVFAWHHRIGSERLRRLTADIKALKNADRRASGTPQINGERISGQERENVQVAPIGGQIA